MYPLKMYQMFGLNLSGFFSIECYDVTFSQISQTSLLFENEVSFENNKLTYLGGEKYGTRRLPKTHEHLGEVGIGYPQIDDFLEVLKKTLTPEEAEIALGLPTRLPPLEVEEVELIAGRLKKPVKEVEEILEIACPERIPL